MRRARVLRGKLGSITANKGGIDVNRNRHDEQPTTVSAIRLVGTLRFPLVILACACSSAGCSSETFDPSKSSSGGMDAGAGTGGNGATGGMAGSGGDGGMAGSGGTAGVGGGSGGGGGVAGDAATNCDATKVPSEDSCVVDDQYGVFVSPVGDDVGGNGTKAKPFRTLSKAVSEAGTVKKRVYACDDGSGYVEASTLDVSALDGTGLFGGFECAAWSYSTASKAQLSGATRAITVSSLSVGLTIENLAVTAADASAPGESSFALAVVSSKNLMLRRVKLVAGAGAAGAAGTPGQKGASGAAPTATQQGVNITCTNAPVAQVGGSWPAASACGSLGGPGGTATKGAAGADGTQGKPTTNVVNSGLGNGGKGGAYSGGSDWYGLPGEKGSDGNAGTVGWPAPSAGTFSMSGFSPASGNAGTDGFPGQGGGGGGASGATALACVGASGGAGGMGGCGGSKGTGGGGGGASVALLTWQSNLTLHSCDLVSQKGGAGGPGGNGGVGGEPGQGGTAGTYAGWGGMGGSGGHGGSGSGGTGGPSIALVYSGAAPVKIGAVTLAVGPGGSGGEGGSIGGIGVNSAPNGSAGVASLELEI